MAVGSHSFCDDCSAVHAFVDLPFLGKEFIFV